MIGLKKTNIENFDTLKESGLFYGGQAGLKLGVKINDENWLLKFPANIKNLKRVDLSYSSSPLSEYIGSHIFGILGYPTHETKLGIRDGRLVVACKDFTTLTTQLIEFREIKNYYNQAIENELDESVGLTKEHGSNLESTLIHFKYNPLFRRIPDLENRFWETSVIDILINNNDRNSGNWGVLFDKKSEEYKIAPIYDNGGSFYNKKDDNTFENYLSDKNRVQSVSTVTQTAYKMNGHILSAQKFLKLENEHLKDAILLTVPKINDLFDVIHDFIDSIPSTFQNICVIGKYTKEFYYQSMKVRFEDILFPRFKEICIERGLNFYDVLYERNLHEDLENIYQFEITDKEYNALLETYGIEEFVDTYIKHFEDNDLKKDLATMCLNRNEWDRDR